MHAEIIPDQVDLNLDGAFSKLMWRCFLT